MTDRAPDIAGYAYGRPSAAQSPVGIEELELLEATVTFGAEDEEALRMAADVLSDQIDDVLDAWYEFIESHPHLLRIFSDPVGKPIRAYLAVVRARFGKWIIDACTRPRDDAWLDYQEEIALRHHRSKKNRTDGADSVDEVPLRYLIALVYPITATLRDFLGRKGHSPNDVDRMHRAWTKSVLLHVALWARPYAGETW